MERIFAGEKMQRCRTAFLDLVPIPKSVLLAGEGHGRFLAACRTKFPSAEITCVDASAAMLDQARRNL
ncbi:MAG TPA: class I SAM-dependent methyltransferase, partial [Verrucomicrobiaceae bacterium]